MEQCERATDLIVSISQTIREQLTKTPNTIEHWGVSEWLTLSKTTLALRVHARYLDGMVSITWHEHHPDKGGDAAKFRQAKEAYDILNHTEANSQDQLHTHFNFSPEDLNQWGELFKDMGADWSSFYDKLTATKKDYVDGIEEILKVGNLDIEQNMPIISQFDEDSLERLGSTLIQLQEQDCLTEETLNIILENINFPRQNEYDTFNPYAGKILIDHYISKNGLVAPSDVPLENVEGLLKALQVLSGDDYEGSQCWPKPSINLVNQDNLNLIFSHLKHASSMAGALACLDHVGLLSNENKTFLSAFSKHAGAIFGALAFSFAGKNKVGCEKILVDAHNQLDYQMDRQRIRDIKKAEQQAPTSNITQTFKDRSQFNKKGIEDYSAELAQFAVKRAAWITNRPAEFERIKELLKEGIITGDNLNKFEAFVIFELAGKYFENAKNAIKEGLMTPDGLNDLYVAIERKDQFIIRILLSDTGLDAMRKGLISTEDAAHFSHGNELIDDMSESLERYNSHNPTK